MKELGALVLTSLVILLLLGLLMYFLTRPIPEPPATSKSYRQLMIDNKTNMPQRVSYKGTELKIPPFEAKALAISLGEGRILAKSRRVDGTVGTYETIVDNPDVHTLYITHRGFRTNLTGTEDVTLRNESSTPIMFIERAANGRRYPSDILPAMSEKKGHFGFRNSTWEVVIPIDEDTPLDTLTVQGIPTQLVFTGERLFAV